MDRIGVFGGRFDPPHIAHMIHAMLVKEIFDFKRLLFIPSAAPPHKTVHASFEDRVKMLSLAIEGKMEFDVSLIEKEEMLSYTVDTLTSIKKKHSDTALYLIVGRDEYDALDTWKNPERIMDLAELIVLPRNGVGKNKINKNAQFPDLPLINISSSMIRERIRNGKSARYMLPSKVEEYILKKNIY